MPKLSINKKLSDEDVCSGSFDLTARLNAGLHQFQVGYLESTDL
jgi:hypothetical protein